MPSPSRHFYHHFLPLSFPFLLSFVSLSIFILRYQNYTHKLISFLINTTKEEKPTAKTSAISLSLLSPFFLNNTLQFTIIFTQVVCLTVNTVCLCRTDLFIPNIYLMCGHTSLDLAHVFVYQLKVLVLFLFVFPFKRFKKNLNLY